MEQKKEIRISLKLAIAIVCIFIIIIAILIILIFNNPFTKNNEASGANSMSNQNSQNPVVI